MSNLTDNLLIRASAGTGKTFQLTNRFLQLLDRGARCEHILATTFTRKAAGEILDRILHRLAVAADDEDASRRLGRELGNEQLSPQRCRELLQHLTRNLHRTRICTLDAFFAQLAHGLGLELNLPAGWQICDESEEAALCDEAIQRLLLRDDHQDVTALMHLMAKGEAQRGVGSLLSETVDQLYSLVQETSAEAWNRFPTAKPLPAAELQQVLEDLRTLPLSGNQLDKARNADYTRAIEERWEDFVSKGLARKVAQNDLRYYRSPLPAAAVEIYRALIRHVRATFIHQLASRTTATRSLLDRFDGHLRQLKFRRRGHSFADITRHLAAHFRHQDDVEPSLFRIDGRVEHLLLDEFQDTSPFQWQVMSPFADRVVGSETATSFFCVGDGKQAIYGWRGGVAEIFEAVGQQLPLQQQQLAESYRSSPEVIDTVNQVFSRLHHHPNLGRLEESVSTWSRQFPRHTTCRKELAGHVRFVTAPHGDDEDPLSPTFVRAGQEIEDLVRQAPGRSIGVLVRTNRNVGHLINELRRRHVPASEEGGNPLTDSAAVLLIRSTLELTDHPGHTAARFHVGRSPLGAALGISATGSRSQMDRVAQQLRHCLAERGYGATIASWTRHLLPACSSRDAGRLEQLVALAYAHDRRSTLRTRDFLRVIDMHHVADASSSPVRVMTIHQAKGLQFDAVVLPDLDVSLVGQAAPFVVNRLDPAAPVDRVCRYVNRDLVELLPTDIQQMFEGQLQRETCEALCLLYVALTRAVHALHLVVAPSTPSERQMPRTLAGLVRAALLVGGPLAPDSTVYAKGRADWHSSSSLVETAPVSAAQPVGPTMRLATRTGGRQRGVQRVTPSSLEGGGRGRLSQLLAGGRHAALERGRMIHAWLEQIHWLDESTPSDEVLMQAARPILGPATDQAEVRRKLANFRQALSRPDMQRLLSRRSYEDPQSIGFSHEVTTDLQRARLRWIVQHERRFVIRQNGSLVSGAIDRLVLAYQGQRVVAADIIDFKTDRPGKTEGRSSEDLHEFYQPQLDAYRQAVQKMLLLPPDRVTARLAFVEFALTIEGRQEVSS